MKLDLSEVATHLGKHIRYEINLSPIDDPEGGLKCIESVTGEVAFSNTGAHIVVRGTARTTVELECARCLHNYRLMLEVPIEEELPLPIRLSDTYEQEQEEELTEEDHEPLFEENVLDLEELLRQDILLSIPIKPICSDICKGLCPHCGRNLNKGPCECPADAENSAFAALTALLREDETDE